MQKTGSIRNVCEMIFAIKAVNVAKRVRKQWSIISEIIKKRGNRII